MNEIELIQAENTAQLQRTKLDEFYNSLEKSDAEYLQLKEYKLAQIVGNAKTEMGKEFKEVQDRLAQNRYGTFQKWIELLDISQPTVYRLINRYDLIVSNWNNKNLIESLPTSLSYEIASPSAPKEFVAKVLNGDITTHKEFIEQKKKLDELKSKNQTLQDDLFSVQSEYETKVKQLESLLQKVNEVLEIEMNKEPIKVIKYEAPAELLAEKQSLEEQLLEAKRKQKIKQNEITKQEQKINQLANEKYDYKEKLNDMAREKSLLEEKINEMKETVEELSMYKDKIDEFKEAQLLLNKHKMDLQNIRLQFEDTQKFIRHTANIKEFINTNLNPILTTLHLPENNNVLKEDVKLICNSLENWILAMKQTFQIN